MILQKKCDCVDEISNIYSRSFRINFATESIIDATGLLLSIVNATALGATFGVFFEKKVLQTASRINSTLSRSFSAPVALNKQNDTTAPEAPWLFIVDQLNTHKSEALVRLVARAWSSAEALGEKEKRAHSTQFSGNALRPSQ